jgi:histidine triad (HIT) family protein
LFSEGCLEGGVSVTDCLFCKIANKELAADIVFEDGTTLAFRDINPQAPVHLLIIPKKHIPSLSHLSPEDRELVGHIHLVAKDLAAKEGIAEDGYRLVVNCNSAAGQTVFHLHFHLLGGRNLTWPPG